MKSGTNPMHPSNRPAQRDVSRLNATPRCQAKTRRGSACQCPAVSGKSRCRMHGGRWAAVRRLDRRMGRIKPVNTHGMR